MVVKSANQKCFVDETAIGLLHRKKGRNGKTRRRLRVISITCRDEHLELCAIPGQSWNGTIKLVKICS